VNNDVVIIDKDKIESKIYIIRGQKVMLDSDLAEIYGYTTKRLNEQVKNNIEKFDEDFMFKLTLNEAQDISRSKKTILKVIDDYDDSLRSKYLTLK
jgi:tRNA G10  N-methylase Trm11